jgi:hypothetical protein
MISVCTFVDMALYVRCDCPSHCLSELVRLLGIWKYYFLDEVRADAKIVWKEVYVSYLLMRGARCYFMCCGCIHLERIDHGCIISR